MIWLYNALLLAFGLALAPVWVLLVLARPRLRRDFGERCRPLRAGPAQPVWLHAASVGEVEAAAPLARALLGRGVPLVVTTLSATGRERLRELIPGLPVRLAPLDLPGLVHLSMRRVRPSVLALVETELWPNLIWAAAGSGTAVVIVSARISDASFPLYRSFRPLFGSVLRSVARISARSEQDRDRYRALGVPVDRALLGGDLKLDRPPSGPPEPGLRCAIGRGPILLGGSTHPGEEEALIAAWQNLRERVPELRLVLAPRHPERVPHLVQTLERLKLKPALRSEGGGGEIVILDTLGELAAVYGLADLVFAGGTLAPVGGHNLIEPLQAGKVVVHGPHTQNQRDQLRLLSPLGVLHRVEDAGGLTRVLWSLWQRDDRHAPARRAQPALASHRGAVARASQLILELREGARRA